MVIVYVYGAHHAPRYWENPESFDPIASSKGYEKTAHPPFTYLPFGGGPRGCIGNHYAMLQILMILSESLLRRYDFSWFRARRSRPGPWSSCDRRTESA
jgi:cytochrome P450